MDLQRYPHDLALGARPGSAWRKLSIIGLWALAVAGLFAFMVWVDMFHLLYDATRAYEDWKLDEVLSLLLCIGVASLFFLAVAPGSWSARSRGARRPNGSPMTAPATIP